MSFARATRRPPLRPESPQARACRERHSSLSPRRPRPVAVAAACGSRRASISSSELSVSLGPAFSLRTCASSRALNSLSPSPSLQSISKASVQSATSARSHLGKLLEKCQAAQRQLDTELCALKGISCEVDARLAQQLRRRFNLLGTSPPCEEDRRSEMEGALRKLQEESAKCRMVKDHMESLIKTAAQVVTGHELFDQRPASVPAFAIQLQKQLQAKLQESRVRCRESAKLGLQSLQKTELREEDMAPFTLLPRGSPCSTAQLAASTASSAALQLVEKLQQKDAESAQWPEPIPCFHGGLNDLQCRWPGDAVIQEEEEEDSVEMSRSYTSPTTVDVCA